MHRLRIRDKSLTVAGLFSDCRKLRKILLALGRKRQINAYIDSHKVRKLQIGAGTGKISGWLATDINPASRDIMYLDATKKLPFPDRTFDYIFCEHMIEHISWSEGLLMLKECRRILKYGGVVRIATPDLSVLLQTYFKFKHTDIEQKYIKWITDTFVDGVNIYKPSFVINAAFRCWGHTFLYDGDLLEIAMREAGFRSIRRVAVGESTHAALKGVERHGNVIEHYGNIIESDNLNKFETMVFEAMTQACNQSRRKPNLNKARLVAVG